MKNLSPGHSIRLAMLVTRMDIGGVPDHIMTLLDGFGPDIHTTLITDHIHPDHRAEAEALRVDIILLPMDRLINLAFDLKTIFTLRQILKDGHFDILHTHMSKAALLGAVIGALSRQIIVVNTAHNLGFIAMPEKWKKAVFWFYDKLISTVGFDATITVSETVGHAVRQARLISNNSLYVIPNGIRLQAFAGTDRSREVLRREIVDNADCKLVVCVARLVWFKGLDTLVDAFSLVVEEHPDARLAIVGDGELWQALAARATELGVENAIYFCGERRDVPDILNAADLFVLSSVSEGLPISLLEAMAARLPIVATDVGGVSELVISGKTGSLVPSGDARQLASAVVQLLNDSEQRERFGTAGYERLLYKFSQRTMVQRTEALYRKLLSVPA